MTNTSTSPQLNIPTIPATDCPKGNVAEVFNYFFQQYLGQATINIPGLGEVTPSEILSLQEKDIDLQNQIDALQINVRSGSGVLTTGDQNITINFSTPMPNNSYSINIELVGTGGTADAACWQVVDTTKLAGQVTIRFLDVPSQMTAFNYCIRQIPV